MKLLTTTLIALLISVSAFAQQDFPRNEIRLNLATTAFAFYPEVFYERVINQELGVGASFGFGGAENYWLYYNLNFNFTPFFRWYFAGNRETTRVAASGFFIEANTSLFSYNGWHTTSFYEDGSWIFDSRYERHFTSGVGVGIGWKYLTNNWIGELLIGGGRSFSSDRGGYPRFAISIGRRF